MDGVVDPQFAVTMGKLGGLAVLNLEGVQTRYENADEQLDRIAALPKESATRTMQQIYQEPIKPELVAQAHQGDQGRRRPGGRVAHARSACASFYEIALEAGLDVLVIQGTVVSAEHVSTRVEPLDLKKLHRRVPRAGDRRRRGQLRHDAAPHAHRRRRRARGRRPGPRLHHARRARHRRAAGHRHRRCRGGARAARPRDRASTATSSPTAACAPAATSARPSPSAPTPS